MWVSTSPAYSILNEYTNKLNLTVLNQIEEYRLITRWKATEIFPKASTGKHFAFRTTEIVLLRCSFFFFTLQTVYNSCQRLCSGNMSAETQYSFYRFNMNSCTRLQQPHKDLMLSYWEKKTNPARPKLVIRLSAGEILCFAEWPSYQLVWLIHRI